MPPITLARWCLGLSCLSFTVAAAILFNHTRYRWLKTGFVSLVIADIALWVALAFRGQATISGSSNTQQAQTKGDVKPKPPDDLPQPPPTAPDTHESPKVEGSDSSRRRKSKLSPTNSGTVNNCPNGICISGGTVENPTVNNFAPSPQIAVIPVFKNRKEADSYLTLYRISIVNAPVPQLDAIIDNPTITEIAFAQNQNGILQYPTFVGEDVGKPRIRSIANAFGPIVFQLRSSEALPEDFKVRLVCHGAQCTR